MLASTEYRLSTKDTLTMKTNFITIACCLLSASAASRTFAQSYTWQYRSPANAIESVRSFEGDPSRQVNLTFSPSSDMSSFNPENGYSLNSGTFVYSIGAYTNDFFFRSDPLFSQNPSAFYGQTYDATVLAPQAMSQSDALAIGQAFMQSHYPQPSLLTDLIVSTESDQKFASTNVVNPNPNPVFTKAYIFYFYQNCGNGVQGPASCKVEVDTIKGEVISYASFHFPVLISTIPGLTGNTAMSSAMSSLITSYGQASTVDRLFVSKPDALGQERLLYTLEFSGVGPTPENPSVYYSYPAYYVANVDANSGAISAWDVLSGMHKASTAVLHRPIRLRAKLMQKPLKFNWGDREMKLNYPPTASNREAYIYSGYLCSSSPVAKITETEAGIFHLDRPKSDVLFQLNKCSYKINGQNKMMSTKPILVNGRCYVPLDVMNAVLPGKFTYDAKTLTVRYDLPQKKVANN